MRGSSNERQQQDRRRADEEDLLDVALVVADQASATRARIVTTAPSRASRLLTVGRCWSGEVTWSSSPATVVPFT